MKLSISSFFVHNSSIKNSAENDVLPRRVFAVLTRKRWAKKKCPNIWRTYTLHVWFMYKLRNAWFKICSLVCTSSVLSCSLCFTAERNILETWIRLLLSWWICCTFCKYWQIFTERNVTIAIIIYFHFFLILRKTKRERARRRCGA